MKRESRETWINQTGIQKDLKRGKKTSVVNSVAVGKEVIFKHSVRIHKVGLLREKLG